MIYFKTKLFSKFSLPSIFLVFLLSSINSYAISWGIGVSLERCGRNIYFPIETKSDWRIEPYLYYLNQERNVNYKEDDYSYDYSYNYETTTLGIGIFKKYPVNENIETYVGPRIAYIYGKSSYDDGDDSIEGFTFAPTFGAEYKFNKHFSAAAEVALQYTKYDGETPNYTQDYSSTNTFSEVILRYVF